MRKILGLLLFGLLLSGCYTNSLTMVGPATGVASGKFSETVASTTVNHVVKKRTGKTPLEHVLSEKQIKTVDKTKAKLNPCEKNKKLCSVVNARIKETRKQLIGLNLQARIEKQHKKIFSKPTKN
tara:strand:+ start:547 stop:921 length:375 start_codon:yes stop_codon:yes gene_type:complete